MPEILISPATVVVLLLAAGSTVWAISQADWGRVALAGLATLLSVIALMVILGSPVPRAEAKEGPVAGCAYANFPVCPPFQQAWERDQGFYGGAITTAALRDGFLTQCFVRGCLRYFPDLPGYQIQGVLLGEDYLKLHGLTADSPAELVMPPILVRWLQDKGRSSDLLRLLGEPLKAPIYDGDIGRDVAVFQRAVLSWPGSEDDIAQVREEPLGEMIVHPRVPLDQPWWSKLWVRLSLLGGAVGLTTWSLVRALIGGEAGGAF